MTDASYQVFVSHGADDAWVAARIADGITAAGAVAFLDDRDIPKGAEFETRIRNAIRASRELIVLFTPWSIERPWLWIEVGAAWMQELPVILGVLYGIDAKELASRGEQRLESLFTGRNLVFLNNIDNYLSELEQRVKRAP